MQRWAWLFGYAVAILIVLVLGTVLGHSALFQSAPLGGGLSASDLVRFIGDVAALALVWLAAKRAEIELRDDRSGQALARRAVVPLAALVILLAGYGVPLFVLSPVIQDGALVAYHWLFVVAVTGATVWLALRMYENASIVTEFIIDISRATARHRSDYQRSEVAQHAEATRATTAASIKRCPRCGRELATDSPSCKFCGAIAA